MKHGILRQFPIQGLGKEGYPAGKLVQKASNWILQSQRILGLPPVNCNAAYVNAPCDSDRGYRIPKVSAENTQMIPEIGNEISRFLSRFPGRISDNPGIIAGLNA